jgi:hypothetical protein
MKIFGSKKMHKRALTIERYGLLTESQYHNIKLRHKSFTLNQRTKLFIQMGHRTGLNQCFKF